MVLRRFIFIITVFGCLACESETVEPSSARSGTEYFPLLVGNFREYAVQNIAYTVSNPPDTQRYFLREVVTDSFPGQNGEFIYRLERLIRPSTLLEWQLDSVWTARANSRRAILVENNIPVVKLVFPFSNSLQWNGNALNAKPADTYELQSTAETLLEEIHSPLDTLLNESVTVVQSNMTSLVNDSVFLETYVKRVGLFYKKSRAIQYCNEESCLGQDIIEYGRDYRQTLIAYGKHQ